MHIRTNTNSNAAMPTTKNMNDVRSMLRDGDGNKNARRKTQRRERNFAQKLRNGNYLDVDFDNE